MPSLAEIAFARPPNVSGAIIRGLEGRQVLNQLSDAERERTRRENVDRLFAGGIPSDPARRQQFEQKAFAAGGADIGLRVREAFQQMSEQERLQSAREGRTVATFLAAAQDQPSWDRARAGISAQGIDVSAIPEQFDAGFRSVTINAARDLEAILAEQRPAAPRAPVSLSPDEILVDPGTGREIARGLPRPPSGEDANRAFSQANTLRDEFIAQTKGFVEAQQGLARVEVGAGLDTGQGDIALIFGFMKTIDPTSTVREGEFATAEQTAGIPGQIVNLYNRLTRGERLTPEQRRGFVDAARAQFATVRQAYDGTVGEYQRLAEGFGLDPANVIIDRVVSQRPVETITPTAAPATTPGVSGDISAMTQEQLGALDPATLTPAERAAAAARWEELNRGR